MRDGDWLKIDFRGAVPFDLYPDPSLNLRGVRIIVCMSIVSLQDLLRDPSGILDRVEAGERFVVAREGHAVAEIRPLARPAPELRPFGLAAGAFSVPADFDAPLPDDLLAAFEGR